MNTNTKEAEIKNSSVSGSGTSSKAERAKQATNEIALHFSKYLVPEVACESTLKKIVYNIRHRVYCEELAFEPARESRQETDEFDDIAQYCLIKHIQSGSYAGCVRLIPTSAERDILPMEKFCPNAIEQEGFHPRNFPRHEICEVSRLAVLPDFRRRKTDQFTGSAQGAINPAVYSEEELRCFPFIAVGLYFSIAALVLKLGYRHAFIMTEPRIARSLGMAGLQFKQLGPTVDYHGQRAPYYINPLEIVGGLSDGLKTLFLSISDVVNEQAEQLN